MNISFRKMLKSDYAALLLVLTPAVAIVLFVDAQYFGVLHSFIKKAPSEVSDPTFFLLLAVVAVVVCLPLLWFRFDKLRQHFKDGIPVQAKIVETSFYKDRGRITFSYEINGREYVAGNAVHRHTSFVELKPGYPITVVVSRANPDKAYIKDLYVADS